MADAAEDSGDLAVVIIGAGPCGLAVAARLVRDCRAAGLDDLALLARIAVVDPAGAWLDAWRAQLGAQRVATLRSPSFVHPHPSRVIDDALRAFAAETGRTHELRPLPATPGWAAPSTALFTDFCAEAVIAPFGLDGLVVRGTAAAVAPCSEGAMVQLDDGRQLRARAVVLALGPAGMPNVPQWARALRSSAVPSCVGGRVIHVSALRATAPIARELSTPRGLETALFAFAWAVARGWVARAVGWLSRASTLSLALSGPWLPRRADDGADARASGAAGRRLLIVGGGLSAAQLALMATDAQSGWSEVVLCARRPLTVRPFDIATSWMARHWSMAFDEAELGFYRETTPAGRAAALATARDGGSVTPEAYAALRARVAQPPSAPARWSTRALWASAPRARLELREGEVVEHAAHELAAGARLRLRVHFARADGGVAAAARLSATGDGRGALRVVGDESADAFDEIWLATGSRVDVAGGQAEAAREGAALASPSLGLLASVQAHWPAALASGRPALTPTLRWAEGAPVYVCGNLSALEIGPDAFNLAGGGAGAARISRDLLPQLADIIGESRLGKLR